MGIAVIPSNDFSFYDQVLDMTATVGAIPPRFRIESEDVGQAETSPQDSTARKLTGSGVVGAGDAEMDRYFAMARGTRAEPAMEMTKWFDTNYHYIVPEFHVRQRFKLSSRKALNEFNKAKALGIHTRPVLIGPVTYLMLGKAKDGSLDPLSLLDGLLPVYEELLAEFKAAGADWVQLDEPVLALDLSEAQRRALRFAYKQLSPSAPKILVASYFGGLGDNLSVAADLPVAGHHVDLVRAPGDLDRVLKALPAGRVLSIGVIDGRNIWRSNLSSAFALIDKAVAARGADTVQVAPSCSLLHCPVDLDGETKLDAELKGWMAFAKQKLAEIVVLATAAAQGKETVASAIAASDAAAKSRSSSIRTHNPQVAQRMATVSAKDLARKSPFDARRSKQRALIPLPLVPTTTIGSFPQTEDVRKARAAHRRGELDDAGYTDFLQKATQKAVRIREELGIDVLVHGEFERNDMVEYFGEQLAGFAITQNGWVQSYGSRYVKPPVIFGDVSRPKPMTVEWSAFAQSLTKRPMKGMVTGPVTILQWSFVRDDQPCSETCNRLHWRSVTRFSIWRRPVYASSKSTSPPCVKACRCVRRREVDICNGPSTASIWQRRASRTRRRSTRICATASSMTSCPRSRRSMPTSFRLRPHAPIWRCWRASPISSIRTRSAQASTISIHRAARARTTWLDSSPRRKSDWPRNRSGPIRIAG
jgi:5-methyltetrahydropteroyltriglutamate--homocysteine methyltransferase